MNSANLDIYLPIHFQVQNFKLHLIKHVTPANQKAKHCRHCHQLIPVNIFSQHLRDMHKETVQFPCPSCTATFSRESNFRSHMEKHIAKSTVLDHRPKSTAVAEDFIHTGAATVTED